MMQIGYRKFWTPHIKERSGTRFYSYGHSTTAWRKHYAVKVVVLKQNKEDKNETRSTRRNIRHLYEKLVTFETSVNDVFWGLCLVTFQQNKWVTSKIYWQSQVLPLFQSLMKFLEFVTGNFDLYIKKALELLPYAT